MRMPGRPFGFWLVPSAFFAACMLCGCEKDVSNYNERSDVGKVRVLVSQLNDIKTLKALNEHYASSAQRTEKDRADLKGLSFVAVEAELPVIEGDKASVQVVVKDAQGVRGTFTWTAVKEGDAWKLTSSPMQ